MAKAALPSSFLMRARASQKDRLSVVPIDRRKVSLAVTGRGLALVAVLARGLTASQTWRYDRQDYQGATGMDHEQVSIPTKDGECPSYVFRPEAAGRHPAVIFYMDGLGIRPTLFEMGQRLANGGYIVLLPDLFYRAGRYEPMDPKKIFATGDVMGAIGHLFISTNNRRAAEDTEAFMALSGHARRFGRAQGRHDGLLHGRRDVAHRRWHLSGSGRGRRASFHGGNLATGIRS